MTAQLHAVSFKDINFSEDRLKTTSRKCQVITFVVSETEFT